MGSNLNIASFLLFGKYYISVRINYKINEEQPD